MPPVRGRKETLGALPKDKRIDLHGLLLAVPVFKQRNWNGTL